ncbi:hypothetical protein AK830_g4197 [Neonectria ditissima]|uniref:Uncharacterized protein n=1 Tax=Neonectria ditissima TaxID=78410 RepID=A0A0N8H7P2_9HYPO|nr:hypothetical protein AK830_g4197 [Neonectria ditissima]
MVRSHEEFFCPNQLPHVVFFPQNRVHENEALEEIHDTVLTLAARRASPELVQRLIDGGSDVHAQMIQDEARFLDIENATLSVIAPFTSSMYASFDAIKVLLNRRGAGVDIPDMVSSRDSRGSLPIYWAAENPLKQPKFKGMVQRILSTLELLLEKDLAIINTQNNDGNAPLHNASPRDGILGKEYTKVFKFLCNRGADASLRNNEGETPLHRLCYCTHGGMPIGAAAKAIVLEHGAKTTDADADGKTPLHHAARNLNNADAVDFLLAHGADVAAKPGKQNTPLHEATQGDYLSMGTRDDCG